jgi:RNA polymerase sigma-70 factor (ECF subfamily)
MAAEAKLMPGGGAETERIAIEAAQRDPARFADLYERNFNLIYAFIIRRVRDRDEAEDLTADVFHDALKNLPRFQWRGIRFSAWLLRIASNAIADRHHRSLRDRRLRDLEDREPAHLGSIEPRARLYRMVDELPADQRRVIAMRFAEQKSIREIARALGRSEGAIKQLQFRALGNLRARMSMTNG